MVRKRKSKFQTYTDDLIFTLRYVVMSVVVDPDFYDDATRLEMTGLANDLANEIIIDRSYVDFKENKHQDTFITSEGWTKLCRLVYDVQFNNRRVQNSTEILTQAYAEMSAAYVNICMQTFGYDPDHFTVEMVPGTRFLVKISQDTVKEWKHYPGKWQDWK